MELESFKFEMGGFSQGGEVVELKKDVFIINGVGGCSMQPIETKPTAEEWIDFLETLDNCNVWGWKKNYDNPHTLDGTQWELLMVRGTSKIKCYGSNDYPPEFDKFINALNIISGTDF